MLCNSDSWDSASCRSEPRSRPLAMEAFYFLYGFCLCSLNGVEGVFSEDVCLKLELL